MAELQSLNPGDVLRGVWIDFIESDESKERPIVIVALRIEQSEAVLFPIYSRKNKTYRPYAIEIVDWQQAGLDHSSFIDVARLTIVDAANLADKDVICVGSLSDNDWQNLISAFSDYQNRAQ
jgi:hypothetical protein